MLNSITTARHAIAAAVNEIVIVGQWCRRKSPPSIPYRFFEPMRINIGTGFRSEQGTFGRRRTGAGRRGGLCQFRLAKRAPCTRNNQHTVRYTDLSPTRFKNLWRTIVGAMLPVTEKRLALGKGTACSGLAGRVTETGRQNDGCLRPKRDSQRNAADRCPNVLRSAARRDLSVGVAENRRVLIGLIPCRSFGLAYSLDIPI